jgi:adenosylcobinamide-phosphate synthase
VALGPVGAVLYRASDMVAARWGAGGGPESGEFGRFATRLFFWLDWVPVRLTALTFAVVGNFEDAVYCWRSQALAWSTRSQGVILAAGAGALGVRLGDTLHQYGAVEFRPELGTGSEADADAMEGAVRLIWRSLVLWMFLVLIVSLAYALG